MKEKHTRRPKVARTGRREEERRTRGKEGRGREKEGGRDRRTRGKEGRGERKGGREGQKDQREGRYFQFTAKNQR